MKARMRKIHNKARAMKAEFPGDLTETEAQELFAELEPMLVYLFAATHVKMPWGCDEHYDTFFESVIEQRIKMGVDQDRGWRNYYSIADIDAVIREVKHPISFTNLEAGELSCLSSGQRDLFLDSKEVRHD